METHPRSFITYPNAISLGTYINSCTSTCRSVIPANQVATAAINIAIFLPTPTDVGFRQDQRPMLRVYWFVRMPEHTSKKLPHLLVANGSSVIPFPRILYVYLPSAPA